MVDLNIKKIPKGPKGKLFTGHLKQFQADPLGFLTKLANEYGEVAKFRLGPFRNVYLVTNPDMIKEVLVTKEKSFVKSNDLHSLKPIFGEGLLTSEKEFHMRQRRLIQPAFKKSHIINYGQDMIDIASKYIDSWKEGEVRTTTSDMMNITLGIICKTMFGLEFKKGYDVLGEPIEEVMRIGIKRMRNIFRWPLWVPTQNNQKYKTAINRLNRVVYSFIDKRREDPISHDDMLGILMEAKEDGFGMTDAQIRDEIMTIFLAGHETTANALSWSLYLISKHPEVQENLLKEIDEVIGDRIPAPTDFMGLTYTQNIVWESMRLYPPAFIVSREADVDIEIGGYLFKKGDVIMMSQYVMHRKEEFFENPELFIPERFENNFVKTIPAYAYFPFGGGARVCIGNHFALMEAVLILAVIAQRYRLTLVSDHHEVTPLPSITLRPKRGLKMVVEKRL